MDAIRRVKVPLPIVAAIAAAGAVVIAGWLAGAGWFMAAERERRELLALGSRLYAVHCAACHGKRLEGQPNWKIRLATGRLPAPPHDASGHTWHHGDAELFLITKKGMGAIVAGYESDMPAYDGVLTDGEIDGVIAFIKSTWPEREREYQATRSRKSGA